MTSFLCFGLILLLSCASWGQSASPILLKNINIVALGGGVELTGREVLLENGKIAAIRAASNKPHPGIDQIEASGKWLIPGLIDLHVTLSSAAQDSTAFRQDCSELLAAGVTTVLDWSGASAQAAHDTADGAEVPALRIFFGCPLLPGAGVSPAPGSFLIKNEQDARQAARTAKAQNAHALYLDPRLEGKLMKAAVQEAQTLGLTTAGVALGFSFEDAGRAGLNWLYDVNSLASASLGTGERRQFAQAWAVAPALLYGTKTAKLLFEAWDNLDPAKDARKKLEMLASRAVFFAPLLAFEEKRLQEFAHTAHAAAVQNVQEKYRSLLRTAFDLQVPLLIGSGYATRDDWRPTIQDEMEAWVQAGIAPRFVLEAATINAGHALRQQDLGQIGEGMAADLVVLEENPYLSFATLRRPWLVIQNGRAYGRAEVSRWQNSPQRAQREIRAVLQRQEQAWNDADIERFMRGYWKSDSTVFASSKVSRGWQAMLERYQHGYPTPDKMGKLKFTIAQIDLMSPDWAKVLGAWELSGLPDQPRGWFTLILRRFEEGWRIVHDHTSEATAAK